MQAQPSTILALQFDLGHRWCLGIVGRKGYFYEAQRVRQRLWGRIDLSFDASFEVLVAQPKMFGHAGIGQSVAQGHGLIPKDFGNALTGLRVVVAPVLKLSGELVELVVGV